MATTVTEQATAKITEFSATIEQLQREAMLKQSELEQLPTHLLEMERTREQITAKIAQQQTEVALREKHASIATGSTVEAAAMRQFSEAKEELQRLQSELTRLAQSCTDEQACIERETARLQSEIEQTQTEIQRLSREVLDYQEIVRRDHEAAGQEKFVSFANSFEKLVKQRDAARRVAASLDADLEALREKMHVEMADWPRLIDETRATYGAKSGPVAQVMAAARAYLNVLQDVGSALPPEMESHFALAALSLDVSDVADLYRNGPVYAAKIAHLERVQEELLKRW